MYKFILTGAAKLNVTDKIIVRAEIKTLVLIALNITLANDAFSGPLLDNSSSHNFSNLKKHKMKWKIESTILRPKTGWFCVLLQYNKLYNLFSQFLHDLLF